ncbi:hypothetical protein QBC39DRAFT_298740 [Podospora conica]|nr:hypothetical protein QBC39DRAFT_298740 [Schizothecium conicum]
MVLIKTAPYGEWESPITAEAATATAPVLAYPRVCPVTGRTFFLESRDDETNSILEITDDGAKHVLPEEYSASTLEYDQGGLPYAIVPGEELRIIFSDAESGSLNLLHVDSGTIEEIQQSPCPLGFVDFDCHPGISSNARNTSWILATQELDDEMEDASVIDRHIVAINLDTKKIVTLLSDTNSYSSPRFSPDGLQISWLQRSDPGPNTQLYLAQFNPETATLSDIRLAAGNDEDSITEPQWSPAGDLFFISSEFGDRHLSCIRAATNLRERISLPGLDHTNFGDAPPTTSSPSYIFLSDSTLLLTTLLLTTHLPPNPTPQLLHINLTSQTITPIPPSLVLTSTTPLSPTSFLVITPSPAALHRASITTTTTPSIETTPLYHPEDSDNNTEIPEPYLSPGQPLAFTTLREPRRDIAGCFFAPRNPRFVGPAGEAPPLVVGLLPCEEGVDLTVQFLTSRGFAYFALDDRAGGGVVGEDDVREVVEYLGWGGRVDVGRVGVVGEEGVVEVFAGEGCEEGEGEGEMGAMMGTGVEVS